MMYGSQEYEITSSSTRCRSATMTFPGMLNARKGPNIQRWWCQHDTLHAPTSARALPFKKHPYRYRCTASSCTPKK